MAQQRIDNCLCLFTQHKRTLNKQQFTFVSVLRCIGSAPDFPQCVILQHVSVRGETVMTSPNIFKKAHFYRRSPVVWITKKKQDFFVSLFCPCTFILDFVVICYNFVNVILITSPLAPFYIVFSFILFLTFSFCTESLWFRIFLSSFNKHILFYILFIFYCFMLLVHIMLCYYYYYSFIPIFLIVSSFNYTV